jgi:hypothetical protein
VELGTERVKVFWDIGPAQVGGPMVRTCSEGSGRRGCGNPAIKSSPAG